MPIPEQFIDELVARSEISDVVSSYVHLTKKGNNLWGLCPFHNEKTPSFSVSPDKQIYHCFGCGKGGGVISFIMEMENLSFPDAVRLLAQRAGMEVPEAGTDEAGRKKRARLLAANKDAARFYHDYLKSPGGARVRDYIAQRQLTPRTATRFGLGAAPDQWDGLTRALTEKGYSKMELINAGLAVAGKNGGIYDKFRARLMLPVIDVRGDVVGFTSRILPGVEGPKYLNTPETMVFHKGRLIYALNFAKSTKRPNLVLVEGNIDVITLHQAGFDNVVATMGTALTEEHARILARYTKELVLCYDNDAAGKQSTDRVLNILKNANLNVRVLQLPNAYDAEGKPIGSVDGHQAYKETHPGAVYLHRGKTYVVKSLDMAERVVRCEVPQQRVNWHTRVRSHKETAIIEVKASGSAFGAPVAFGWLRVTETITGYEQRSVADNRLICVVPLDLPPLVFETEGLWFCVPDGPRRATEDSLMHFMGSIHALEHASIGLMPLMVMADRNDFGGISTPMHAQLGMPAVFVYDGLPGGAGLCRSAFPRLAELFAAVRDLLLRCPCELGCPSCVHSPKCGSGNRPIDKAGALFLLERIMEAPAPSGDMAVSGLESEQPKEKTVMAADIQLGGPEAGNIDRIVAPLPERFMVLDVETRRSAAEVGGWHRADLMGVSVAVLYDSKGDCFTEYEQEDLPAMFERLREAGLVIGFNSSRFDYAVLQPFAGYDLRSLPTLDMLVEVKKRLSYRVSLDNLARATLNAPKSADGMQALQWWKEGNLASIAEYCRKDVEITRDVYLFGHREGYLLFTNKAGQQVRVVVEW